jgi:hypothetical protein
VFATTFVSLDGNGWSYLVAAKRSDVGWAAHAVAGGSDGWGHATNLLDAHGAVLETHAGF